MRAHRGLGLRALRADVAPLAALGPLHTWARRGLGGVRARAPGKAVKAPQNTPQDTGTATFVRPKA